MMSGQTSFQTQTEAKPTFTPIASGVLQRQCACGQHTSAGGECEACQQKRGGTLQRASVNSSPVLDVPPMVHEVLRSPGQLLDATTRTSMEQGFGHDFSNVKVHVGEQAADSARAVNALAYTVGHDIVFGAGQYATQSNEGKKVLAHELAHTIQQGPNVQRLPDRLETTEPSDQVEREAEAAAESVMHRMSSPVSEGHGGMDGKEGPAAAPEEEAAPEAGLAGKDLPKKTVTVNVTYLKGGSTDIATHLTKANTVYAAARVDVKKGKEKTLDEAASKAILGDDLILDEFDDPATPTTEEKALIKENRTAKTITMYYVGSMSKGSIGEAFYPAAGQPASFVYASPNTRTWPHELGHVLLDSGDHPGDADNFMAQTSVASGVEKMTADQITKIRGSTFVK
jgi:hypothetical protein